MPGPRPPQQSSRLQQSSRPHEPSRLQEPAREPRAGCEPFGLLRSGEPVERYTLTNRGGMRVRILTYGGIVQTIEVPDRDGRIANVALGLPTLDAYVTSNAPYFGAVIGRYANRIAHGQFTLDGISYQVPVNDGSCSLHGGTEGFDSKVWTATTATGDDRVELQLSYRSPSGEMGFPGTLSVAVRYTLTDGDALAIDYRATTDRPTVVNLTNHTYLNLAGEGSGTVYDHELFINASRYTPVDTALIPSGELAPVAGTPMDFTVARTIGSRIREGFPQLGLGPGYDHNYVLDRTPGQEPTLAARVTEATSGRVLSVHTDQPGMQFYSANFLRGDLVGTGGRVYRQSDGFALETQHFPDSPNRPEFPSTVLRPGEAYRSTTVYQFSTD